MKDRTLITGATGFLGLEMVRQFEAKGIAVCTTGRAAAVDLPDYRPCDLVGGDGMEKLMSGVRCVVHAAGLAHQFGPRKPDRDRFFEVNATATESLAEAAARAAVEHFVFISSMSVYGNQCPTDYSEGAKCRPEGAYAESKWEAERRLTELAARAGFRLTILRLATLYGEGDPGNVARLMRGIDRRRFVWIGRGNNRKTLIHRNDAARAVVLAAERSGGAEVEIFNIAAPPVRMREVVELLARELGKKVPRIGIPGSLVRFPLNLAASVGPLRAKATRLLSTLDKWLGDSVLDGSKFFREFDFSPGIELAEGVRREVEWYRGAAGHNPD